MRFKFKSKKKIEKILKRGNDGGKLLLRKNNAFYLELIREHKRDSLN